MAVQSTPTTWRTGKPIDLDLFTPALDKINDIVDLVIADLERQSILVTVTRRIPGFIQLSKTETEPDDNESAASSD